MAGIYFHIPFCKQACHYCDFHFSTSLKYRHELLQAMHEEIILQARYLKGATIETLYFGGGTPSILTAAEIQQLIDQAANHYTLSPDAEITLEANPDDLEATQVSALRGTSVNRFSIGIQSFFGEDLRWMNRAHGAADAETVIKRVQDAGFQNITADLIYGYPLLDNRKWQQNIEKLVSFNIPHISAYSMTIEPQTVLGTLVRKGKQMPMDEQQSALQFEYLMDALGPAGYTHYEISNFAKPSAYARHNSNYWRGIAYLGIGPSAHSFDGDTRQWNVSNNAKYIRALQQGQIPYEREQLTARDKLNEYIMTSLRTMWGLNLERVEENFGQQHRQMLYNGLQPFLSAGEVSITDQVVVLTRKGKLMADRIAAELFVDGESVDAD